MSGTSSKKNTKKETARTKSMFVRVTLKQYREIQRHAKKYAQGNLSEWVRTRSLNPMLDVSIKMQDEIDGGLPK